LTPRRKPHGRRCTEFAILTAMSRHRAYKKWLLRILAVGLGVVFALALAEVALRALAWILVPDVHRLAQRADPNADVLIVCAGDSHTQGVGAPAGLDYPSQLAALLAEQRPSRRYAVVNLGRAGSNSSEAVNRVLEFLAQTSRRPDIVVFGAGKNNDHNLHDASIFGDRLEEDDYAGWARYLLANARVSRLSTITRTRLEQWLGPNHPSESAMHHDWFLDVAGKEEQTLLADWILADIARLKQVMTERGGKIILLNYYLAVPWVDRAYREAEEQYQVPLINVHSFGLPMSPGIAADAGLLSGSHPSARGYARIADKVQAKLAALGWL
jgi:lysophospholipase L1-like esterase